MLDPSPRKHTDASRLLRLQVWPACVLESSTSPAVEAVVAEAPWSEAEWAVALRFDNPRATVLVRV